MQKIYSVGKMKGVISMSTESRKEQLKNIEMKEAWPDIYNEGCKH